MIENNPFWVIGKNYFIRTVTMIDIGKLEYIDDKELVLSNASWIPETGRFYNSIKDGDLNEVEPFIGNIVVNRQAIIDAVEWTHSIDLKQK